MTLISRAISDSLLCHFFAPGRPQVKGNMRASAFAIGKTLRSKLYDANKGLSDWTKNVRGNARVSMGVDVPVDFAVRVDIAFSFRRPKSHYTKTGALSAQGRRVPDCTTHRLGDIDKLTRAVLDSLTGVAYVDDKQVVELYVSKVWSGTEGAVVRVYRNPKPTVGYLWE